MTNIKFILASSSPYRRQLLEKLQFNFQCISPNIDETAKPSENPLDLVKRLAISKAKKIAETLDHESIIIASDQVATFENKILGKPHTKENAIKQLSLFSGNKVIFYTSLCVLNSKSSQYEALVEPFSVYFRQLSYQEIESYIDKEKPLNCAGSFKSEGLGILLFEKLEGDDPNTLIGLPLIQLNNIFKKMGIELLS